MAITNISRDYGVDPSIVRIITTDNLAAITTAGYLIAQDKIIQALINGVFQWTPTDYVLIFYNGGEGFFLHDAINFTFIAASTVPGSLSNTLLHNRVFVGSAANIATGVPMTGDVAIDDTGLTTIQDNVISSTQLAKNTVQYISVPVTSAQFKNLNAVEIPLVPAQGANKLIIVNRWVLQFTYGTVQYQNGGLVGLAYSPVFAPNTGDAASDDIAAAEINSLNYNAFIDRGPLLGTSETAVCANHSLDLGIQGPDFTDGDSDMVIHVWYSVIDV